MILNIGGCLGSLTNKNIDGVVSRLSFVDALRGIAVLMVVLSHTSQAVGGKFFFSAIGDYVSAGDRGVQLFFIISSFTLFRTSLKRYATDRRPLISFYIRRSFRILPFWWLIALFWWAQSYSELYVFFLAATFLFGFVRFLPYTELVPGGWTLFIEETFYFFLPLIHKYIKDIWGAITFVLFLLSVRAVGMLLFANTNTGRSNNAFVFSPINQWFVFGFGILAFFLLEEKRIVKILSRKRIALMLDMLAIFLLIVLLGQDILLSSIALLGLFVVTSNNSGYINKLSAIGVLIKFGQRCYSIYLLQFVLLLKLTNIFPTMFDRLGIVNYPKEIKLLIAYIVTSGLLYMISYLSFRFIEEPCIRYGKKLADRINFRRLASTPMR